jgi:hypothetical protein
MSIDFPPSHIHFITWKGAEQSSREFQTHTLNQRKKTLDDMHSQLKKYLNRMPAALVSHLSAPGFC